MTRFVHLTDLHISHPQSGDKWLRADTPAQMKHAVEAILRLKPLPDFVVASGDLTNLGDPLSYHLLQEILSPLPMPVLLGLGNHDKRTEFHQAFQTGKEDLPHDHDCVIGGIHIITLDSLIAGAVSGRLEPAQLAWLEGVLALYPDVPKLISVHHAPRVTGTEIPWEVLDQESTDRLGQLLQGAKVIGILSGHVHINAVRMWNGIPLYLSQGLNTTIDLLEAEDMRILEGTGFTLFDLHPAGLSASFVPLTPQPRELGFIPAERLKAFS